MVVTRNQSRLVSTSCDGDAQQPQAVRTGESSQEANPVTTTHIPTSSRSNSITSRTSRSSAMITARKLAAEAQHARHVAISLPFFFFFFFFFFFYTAELEHQAEIAAIEASSSHHGTKSGRSRGSIKQWLIDTERNNLNNSLTKNRESLTSNNQIQNTVELSAAPIPARPQSVSTNIKNYPQVSSYPLYDTDPIANMERTQPAMSRPDLRREVYELPIHSSSEYHHKNGADDNVLRLVNAFDGTLHLESRWMSGPTFLLSATTEWPNEPLFDVSVESSDHVELKPSAHIEKSPLARLKSHSTASYNIVAYNSVGKSPKPVAADPDRFSSWLRMLIRLHRMVSTLLGEIKIKNFPKKVDICLKAARGSMPLVSGIDSTSEVPYA
ncbi:hypothetical protein ACJJTC_012012 [Scirpophaga incertulas]